VNLSGNLQRHSFVTSRITPACISRFCSQEDLEIQAGVILEVTILLGCKHPLQSLEGEVIKADHPYARRDAQQITLCVLAKVIDSSL
jgi:hypothetical protein